jgi:hypothetical protein
MRSDVCPNTKRLKVMTGRMASVRVPTHRWVKGEHFAALREHPVIYNPIVSYPNRVYDTVAAAAIITMPFGVRRRCGGGGSEQLVQAH